jgi:hypothetical protein
MDQFTICSSTIFNADALSLYPSWPSPTVIISDGAYGLGLFPGDPPSTLGLPAWYEPHIAAWAQVASSETTLWMWNTEVGWASIHPVLLSHGWKYVRFNLWDKGIAHIAGRCNLSTLRQFPCVSECCVQYVRSNSLDGGNWFRSEWIRSGLPLSLANAACGVKDAATRKYLCSDFVHYSPPPNRLELLRKYANEHGDPSGAPYFVGEHGNPAVKRFKFRCPPGITNVWRCPSPKGLLTKPHELIRLIIEASSNEGDVAWEPFGGTCPCAAVSSKISRQCFSAESDPRTFLAAKMKLSPPE